MTQYSQPLPFRLNTEKAFTKWQSGDRKPVLEIKLLPDDLTKRYELKFREEPDDLDWCQSTHFFDQEIGPVVLLRYQSAPIEGTLCYIDSKIDSQVAIQRIIEDLGLVSSDILWSVEM
jgi:hypothetical protein